MIPASTHIAALALLFSGTLSTPMGEEAFGNEPVLENEEWAGGVVALANDPHRVYRRWVNGNEEFFFSGDSADVNAALARFAEIEVELREVILLPQAGSTRSFDDKRVVYGWRLYAPSGICLGMARKAPSPLYPAQATLTVHVTSSIQLAKLDLPAGVSLLGPADLVQRYAAATEGAEHSQRASLKLALEQLESRTKSKSEERASHNEALRELIVATRGVDLELGYDEQENRFTGALVNRRSVPVTIVLPGDGSEPGMRTPHIRWDIRDAETGERMSTGWIGCGNIDAMRAEEIVTLAPGQRQPISVTRRLWTPGRYRVVLRYDNDPKRGIPRGHDDAPEVLALVHSSDRLVLASRPIEVTVR